MIDRRAFLVATAGSLVASSPSFSQPAAGVKRLGVLNEGAPFPIPAPLREAWRSIGWAEGENLLVERRFAQTQDQLPAMAADLLAWRPDMVVTFGTPAALTMKRATSTVPVMFIVARDPVESGLVASLARPGGNLTGFCNGLYDGRKLQLIKDLLPRARVIAYPEQVSKRVLADAASLGLSARGIPIDTDAELPHFFQQLRTVRADAVVLPPITWYRPETIRRFASEFLAMKMVAVAGNRGFVEAGGLLSMSPREVAMDKHRLLLFDRLLRGDNPAETAVQLPTEFDQLLNGKTAAAFGLRIPPAVQHGSEII